MSVIWLYARTRNAMPPLCSVYLSFDNEETQEGITRYLMSEFGGRVLPFGIDRFDSAVEAKQRCQQDMGISFSDWQEVSAPEFHGSVVAAREQAIANYLNDAQRRDRITDNPESAPDEP